MKKTLILIFYIITFLSLPISSLAQIEEPFYKPSGLVDDTTVCYVAESRDLTKDSVILVPARCCFNSICCRLIRTAYTGFIIGFGYEYNDFANISDDPYAPYPNYHLIDLSIGYYSSEKDIGVELEYQYSPTRHYTLEYLPIRSDYAVSVWTNVLYKNLVSKYMETPILRPGMKIGYNSIIESIYLEPKLGIPFYLVNGHAYTSVQIPITKQSFFYYPSVQFGAKFYVLTH